MAKSHSILQSIFFTRVYHIITILLVTTQTVFLQLLLLNNMKRVFIVKLKKDYIYFVITKEKFKSHNLVTWGHTETKK